MTKSSRAKKAGRAIPDGPKAQIKWDFLDNNDYLTGQHNYDDIHAAQAEEAARIKLLELEAEGRANKASRVKKEINLATEARWAVRSSWCPTCLNVFHNCQCPPPPMPNKVEVDFIQSIFGREDKEAAKARKKEEARARRRIRKGQ